MKRKTIAKLLGAALTLAVTGTGAQAMTGVYEDGNRTVYICRGGDEVYYTVSCEGEEEANVSIVQEEDGTIIAKSEPADGTAAEFSDEEAVIEKSVSYQIGEGELEEGGYYTYTITANEAGEVSEYTIVGEGDGEVSEYTIVGEEEVALTVTEENGIDSEEIVNILLAELEAVGITSDEESGALYYEGKSIRWLLDEQSEEDSVIIKVDGGEITVCTVRDEQGNLTGVQAAQ